MGFEVTGGLTVEQLIEKLQRMPRKMVVHVLNDDGDCGFPVNFVERYDRERHGTKPKGVYLKI